MMALHFRRWNAANKRGDLTHDHPPSSRCATSRSLGYGRIHALRGVNLSVKPGRDRGPGWATTARGKSTPDQGVLSGAVPLIHLGQIFIKGREVTAQFHQRRDLKRDRDDLSGQRAGCRSCRSRGKPVPGGEKGCARGRAGWTGWTSRRMNRVASDLLRPGGGSRRNIPPTAPIKRPVGRRAAGRGESRGRCISDSDIIILDEPTNNLERGGDAGRAELRPPTRGTRARHASSSRTTSTMSFRSATGWW